MTRGTFPCIRWTMVMVMVSVSWTLKMQGSGWLHPPNDQGYIPLHQVDDGHGHGLGVLNIKKQGSGWLHSHKSRCIHLHQVDDGHGVLDIKKCKDQVGCIPHKSRYIPLHQVDDGHGHGLGVQNIFKKARVMLTASSTSPGTFPCIMWTIVMVMVSVSWTLIMQELCWLHPPQVQVHSLASGGRWSWSWSRCPEH